MIREKSSIENQRRLYYLVFIRTKHMQKRMNQYYSNYKFYKKILRLWKKDIAESHVTVLDSKTKLQEYSLKHFKKLPKYCLLSSRGPKHNPIFKISVIVNESRKFIGLGNSKKQAEQDAASKLLKDININ